MAEVMEAWVGELSKLGERMKPCKRLLMQKAKKVSKQQQQQQPEEADKREKQEATTMSETTVCLLMDRFVPW
ncbi:PREDICTED: uncharacterized protein LOC109116249 [Tarenaya hassleriana]|uniref:uncharacterized protein LOC109116249 n=1 Tax=Tarenaya hassleriana TaxID=28532 RepID=UPI0008FD2BE1|nr:PREDICTED: uncharacterized protein LOC109116249 [Tarenaya hassleriana]